MVGLSVGVGGGARGAVGGDRRARRRIRDDDAEETAAKADAGKPGGDACIDEDVKADLFAKRKQRTSRERLFQQTNRHELTLRSGYYVVRHVRRRRLHASRRRSAACRSTRSGSSRFAYAYHMTEDFAVEATAAVTQLTSTRRARAGADVRGAARASRAAS